MAGPTKNLLQGRVGLREKLNIEPETGLDIYLGCAIKAKSQSSSATGADRGVRSAPSSWPFGKKHNQRMT